GFLPVHVVHELAFGNVSDFQPALIALCDALPSVVGVEGDVCAPHGINARLERHIAQAIAAEPALMDRMPFDRALRAVGLLVPDEFNPDATADDGLLKPNVQIRDVPDLPEG